MSSKILFVDDDQNLLDGVRRTLRGKFNVDTAQGGPEALARIETSEPYAVIISDMKMPGMDGVQLLSEVKERAPDTVRIMLTGNADQQTAIEAVNEGHIFRFLTKPCPPEALAKTLSAGLEQYRLIRAEKELLEQTLRGSVQVLTDVLSLVNPTAFGRASRVRRLVRQLADIIGVVDVWQIEIAAMLSQVGCITVPEETLKKVYDGSSLTPEELRMLQTHPQIGHDLIERIPRLGEVAEMIAYQEKLFNGAGSPPNGKRGYGIPLGSRLLKLALDFDKLSEAKVEDIDAVREIKRREGWYDEAVVEALCHVVKNREVQYDAEYVNVSDLRVHMILADDIMSTSGVLLIAKGQDITISLRLRLENFLARGGIQEPIKVFVPIQHSERH
jgi:response regulator RpfG family c-di-GMP phosphodiesterase